MEETIEKVYDSTKHTQEHIDKVNAYMIYCSSVFAQRGLMHDLSKLESPEKEYFDKYTPLLPSLVYGSDKYKECVKLMKPCTDHHYLVNDHHPQHFEKGINGMNLFQIVEMFFDWRASTERGLGGDIMKSIAINAERFGISKQLRQILINTEEHLRKNNR